MQTRSRLKSRASPTKAELERGAKVAQQQGVRVTISTADKTWTIDPAPEATEQPGRSLPVHVAPEKEWRL
jgi:hypothetical protein